MRILFAGSPAIAIPSLKIISSLELDGKRMVLSGILTNPDSARGRGGALVPTDISAAAAELDILRAEKGLSHIPQLKPSKLNSAVREDITRLKPDLLVSFAYGKIFGPKFLSLFPLGGINIHPSLLPKFRGASPIPSVILAGEKETGICIQKLALEMDSGDIITNEKFSLSGRETTFSLSEIVSEKAAFLLRELLLNFNTLFSKAEPQNGNPSYCTEIKKEEGIINWSRTAAVIDAGIRAFNPWPLCFTHALTPRGKETLFIIEAKPLDTGGTPNSPGKSGMENPGKVLGVDKTHGILIQTGDGVLAVSRLQWQAKKVLDWRSFMNGARDFIGSSLGGSLSFP